jgi:hypothetical protein
MDGVLDPRVNAFRANLADERLKGQVSSTHFTAPSRLYVSASSVFLHKEPQTESAILTELLIGEETACFEKRNGWVWVQAKLDDYVGYAPASFFTSIMPKGERRRVTRPFSMVYPEADIKSPASMAVPMHGYVWLGNAREAGFVQLCDGKWIGEHCVAPRHADFVEIAKEFLHTPYLWGGKSWLGIDCSGLVQIALQMAGRSAPRDSDLQEKLLEGTEITTQGALAHGDLVFWPGHVGIFLEGGMFLHANAYHKRVVIEKFETLLLRDKKTPISKILRLSETVYR